MLDVLIDILKMANEGMNKPEDRLIKIIQAKIHK